MIIEKNESALGRHTISTKCPGSVLYGKHTSATGLTAQLNNSSQQLGNSVARQNLASAIEHGSGRKSLSESLLVDSNSLSTNVSLRRQFDNDEEYNTDVRIDKTSEYVSYSNQVDGSFVSFNFWCQ